MKARPGPELAGRAYMKRLGLAFAQSSSSWRGRRRRDLVGHVFEQRPGRVEHDARRPGSLRERLHLRGAGQIDLVELGQLVGEIGQHLRPQLLLDAGRQRVDAGQHDVDVDAVGVLLRLDLAGQLRRGRFGEGDLGDELGLRRGIGLDGLLRERQIAGDIDDVERDRR